MTRHHTDPDATPTSQTPFWNDDADWTPSALERRSPRVSVGAGATVTRWWDSLLGGDAPAGRAHGVASSGPRRASGGGDAPRSEAGSWNVEPRSHRANSGGLDPKIARIGGLIVAVTVAVPLFLGFTSAPDDDTLKTADAAPTTTVATITTVTIPAGDLTQSDTTEASGNTTTSDSSAASTSATSSSSSQSDDTTSATAARSTGVQAAPASSDSSESSDANTSSAAPAASSSSSTSTGPACGNSYEIVAGDYWIRIADAADVSLSDLLAVNDASTSTELLPGRSICLPVGASTPAPPTTASRPTTTSPPTTSRPTTTSPPATNPPTTNAPNTTRPPTTTTRPPTTAPPSSSDVEAIIRSVWPDHLEERALTIAWRESRHVPTAYNGHCCYGLFQMYYTVHQNWLRQFGVYSASDLYDPVKNAKAAYALYQSQGWDPWRMTDPGS